MSKPPIRVDEPLFDSTSDFMLCSTANEANEPNEFNEPQGQGNMQSKLDSPSKEIERSTDPGQNTVERNSRGY
ncbi:hypothetical protein N3K66_009065 [Trichothecium roseum]|uniref:Uncharacterized protein n=1 Tax=Trichothecium roseum TaxID=47278 RepID=A0ACC0UQR4_9HYPO|nr:hypothetical protein N3K66_009065 [Trichothecium roseum]